MTGITYARVVLYSDRPIPPSNRIFMLSNQPNPERQSRPMEICSLLALLLGIAIRLSQYLSGRSLWFDEVAVILNLQERTYGELLGSLNYEQAAPPLFLWIEKFALETLGNNEYSLRLYPLLGGLLSLVVFYHFTRQYAMGWARPIAMLLFSTISYVVYFSSELKPYSWDVTIGMLLFMSISAIASLKPNTNQLIGVGLLGTISIWLSFPSILVMASIEAANLLKLKLWKASRADWQAFLLRRVPLYAAWLMSLVGLYVMVVSKTLTETDLSASWADRYPENWYDLLWGIDALGRFFYRPLYYSTPLDGIAMVVFIIGLVHLWRKRGWQLAYLGAPFIVTMLASYLQQYPFQDRLILFLVPYSLVILGEGMALLLGRSRKRPKIVGAVGVALVGLLLVLPLSDTLPRAVNPSRTHYDHVRPAIAHIYNNWKPDDKLFVFYWTQLQFQYYKTRYDFPPKAVVLSQLEDFGQSDLHEGDIERLSQEISALKAGPFKGQDRVWFLMARKHDDVAAEITDSLEQLGKSLEITRYPTVVVNLMDLSE